MIKFNIKTTWHYQTIILLIIRGFLASSPSVAQSPLNQIDLSGTWQFRLDSARTGIREQWYDSTFVEKVILPGTTDQNKKGKHNLIRTTEHLTREYTYCGSAWYQKKVHIPPYWTNKNIELFLERTKQTKVWIDGQFIGKDSSLCVPHTYDVSNWLTPGSHFICIEVDNTRELFPVGRSHQLAEHTQTNWNGIVGQIFLKASSKTRIAKARIFADVTSRSIKPIIQIEEPQKDLSVRLEIKSFNHRGKVQRIKPTEIKIPESGFLNKEKVVWPQNKELKLWDEFSPNLYEITIQLVDKTGQIIDSKVREFGFYTLSNNGTQFTINHQKTFFRGKHDACVFPLTGYASMELNEWMRIFSIAREYGINHYRFHSWCPPAAAFKAANRTGIYLQAELPNWKGFRKNGDEHHFDYMQNEGLRILDTYGDNPSFLMFTHGNELSGDRQIMTRLRDVFREHDPRRFYAIGTNYFFGNPKFQEGDDFWVTMRTGARQKNRSTDIRGSFGYVDDPMGGGYVNAKEPSTKTTYTNAIKNFSVPIVSHEIAQYQAYPHFNQIEKYTGVLKPHNFDIFKQRLDSAGMLDQATDFAKASGKLMILCYREEIEAALRTPGFGGFQLLDLQDFPGQGTALVGVLDAFMDSKGLIEPEEWRQFCSEVVPLALFNKYTYRAGEVFEADIKVANYGKSDLPGKLEYFIKKKGKNIAKGYFKSGRIKKGSLHSCDKMVISLPLVSQAEKMVLELVVADKYINEYYIWVYPEAKLTKPNNTTITDSLDQALESLEKGERVVYFPAHKEIINSSVKGMFIPDFWCYPMFKAFSLKNNKAISPGTLGIFTDPLHPVFEHFPTEYHTNWQWWHIIKNSRVMELDKTSLSYRPIIQLIDNFDRNHKYGILFEFQVGEGRLLVSTTEFDALKTIPEGRQYWNSIMNYASSDLFKPTEQITGDKLKSLFEKNNNPSKQD